MTTLRGVERTKLRSSTAAIAAVLDRNFRAGVLLDGDRDHAVFLPRRDLELDAEVLGEAVHARDEPVLVDEPLVEVELTDGVAGLEHRLERRLEATRTRELLGTADGEVVVARAPAGNGLERDLLL